MAPASKRQRDSSRSAASGGQGDIAKASKAATRTSSKRAAPLATFADLPEELRLQVLDLACYRRATEEELESSTIDSSLLFRIDFATIARLALVSRYFHDILLPVLWSHVKLTRPSHLASFHRALTATPARALLVKSLHLGPLDDLPEGWWPFRWQEAEDDDDEPYALFRCSLTRRDEALGLLPRWCSPGMEWAYELPSHTCQERRVAEAIRTALRGVGVEHDSPSGFVDRQGNSIGINEWTIRLFEAQGVLDVYLREMRRIEDAEKRSVSSLKPKKRRKKNAAVPRLPAECRSGKCGHYPRLVLEGFPGVTANEEPVAKGATATQDGDGGSSSGPRTRSKGLPAGEATSSKVKASKKAKKSASSGEVSVEDESFGFIVTPGQVQAHMARCGAHNDHFDHPLLVARSGLCLLTKGNYNTVMVDPMGCSDKYSKNYSSPSEDGNDSVGNIPSRKAWLSSSSGFSGEGWYLTRRDGILGLARSILGRTSNLKNLSLTSFLHHAVDFEQQLPIMNDILYLSVGPLLPYTEARSCLSGKQLLALQKYRICGHFLDMGIAGQIAGLQGFWPQLREAVWDFGHTRLGHQVSADYLVDLLNILQGRLRLRLAKPNDKSRGRYVEVRLHPNYIPHMLNMAPTRDVRAAWQEGRPVSDAPHRLRLLESEAALNSESRWREPPQDISVLRRGSEQGWEERALELGLTSLGRVPQ